MAELEDRLLTVLGGFPRGERLRYIFPMIQASREDTLSALCRLEKIGLVERESVHDVGNMEYYYLWRKANES